MLRGMHDVSDSTHWAIDKEVAGTFHPCWRCVNKVSPHCFVVVGVVWCCVVSAKDEVPHQSKCSKLEVNFIVDFLSVWFCVILRCAMVCCVVVCCGVLWCVWPRGMFCCDVCIVLCCVVLWCAIGLDTSGAGHLILCLEWQNR